MAAASRVVVCPPDRWDDERLLQAARELPTPTGSVRPGDAVGDLVVVAVEPEPGAEATRSTVVEISPQPRPVGGRTLDVAILLDASESMAQPWSAEHTRWSAAGQAMQSFLSSPGPHLRLVSLFIYARSAQLLAGPVASSKVAPPELTPRGRSMTGTGLNAALAYLAEHASSESQQAVLILTDGAGEIPELERATERAIRLRVPVHVLSFSPGNDANLDKLARRTGGTCQRASNPPSFVLSYSPSKERSA